MTNTRKAGKSLISIVIPVYKPEEEVFEKVKKMLRKQTLRNIEIVENWNMPEAESMNAGIKKSRGDIIVILAQDCIPENKFWLEKLVEPLKDEKVVASGSKLYLPKEYWKTYPLMTRMITIDDLNTRGPFMDIRATAFRRKDLYAIGLIKEKIGRMGLDGDAYTKLIKMGRIEHPNVRVLHLHRPGSFRKTVGLLYSYSKANGVIMRDFGLEGRAFIKRVLRALPFVGIISAIYRFPFREHPSLLPIQILMAPIINVINVYGFWSGFFSKKR
jgi:glycosyltransferase involved in cell wall biosynthesis